MQRSSNANTAKCYLLSSKRKQYQMYVEGNLIWFHKRKCICSYMMYSVSQTQYNRLMINMQFYIASNILPMSEDVMIISIYEYYIQLLIAMKPLK